VHISVVKARDLIKADLVGSSDPYVVLTIGDRTISTVVVKNSLNPEWNQNFEVSLPTKPTHVALKVWDKDSVGKDDFLGEATVPLVFGDEHKEYQDWVPLTKIKSGAVYLRISCFGPATSTTTLATTVAATPATTASVATSTATSA
jgi:Ca2+-dependent lipid-binding protein